MTKTFQLHTGERVTMHVDRIDCEVVVEGEAHLVLSESDIVSMMLCWREALAFIRGKDVCD